jgi:hypothetical protein
METIRQVIYISQAIRPMKQEDIEELVATASHNNRQLGITGALLYIENSFVQVLEGEDAPITRLLATIESDPRHRNMRILSDRTIDFRNFEDWSMAYVKPDPQGWRRRSDCHAPSSYLRHDAAPLRNRRDPAEGKIQYLMVKRV